MKNLINSLKYVSGFIMAAMLLVGLTTGVSAQVTHTRANTNSIQIEDEAPANPYPSEIVVNGVPTNATRFTVKLKGFTHAYPDDVGVLIVAPNGAKLRLFTDCMGDGGGNGITTPIDLTIDDFATLALPDNPSGDTPSGTYKPKRGTSDGTSPEHPLRFAEPAPDGPYADSLASFDNINPNGTWKIFVDDDGNEDEGVIQGGWEISFQTMAPTAAPGIISGHVNIAGSSFNSARVTMTAPNGKETVVYTDWNGYYEFPAVDCGEIYVLRVFAKGRTFSPNTQVITLSEDTTVDWFGM